MVVYILYRVVWGIFIKKVKFKLRFEGNIGISYKVVGGEYLKIFFYKCL